MTQTRSLIVAALALLLGCGPQTTSFGANLPQSQGGEIRPGRTVLDPLRDDVNSRTVIISPGSDQFLNSAASRAPLVDTNAGGTNLNLVNVPIADAARAVLGEALGLAYTIDPAVTGMVTIQTSRPVNNQELLDIFDSAIELSGFALSRNGERLVIVTTPGGVPQVTQVGDPNAVGRRVIAVPLSHIGAAEMTRLLTPIVQGSVSIQPIENRSILLLTGNRSEVNAALETVNLFDVDTLAGKSVAVFRLKSANPESIVTELDQIFGTGPGGELEGALTFVPNSRLGAVLAIATRQQYIDRARVWVGRLDATADRNRRRPVVYSVENRSAESLAPILADLAGASAEAAPGAEQGGLRVVADDSRNAIVVWGNDEEQGDMSLLLASLDTTAVQVMLEATIAEVTLRDELEAGVQWFFQNNNFRSQVTDGVNGTINRSLGGLSVLFDNANAAAVLNALDEVTNVEIVSSPSLLVLDNETASLQIGDEVPIATQTRSDPGSTAANTVVSEISFRETGIILDVRPRVSQSGLVSLDIEQEVSNVAQTTSSGIDSPTISQRRIRTRVQINNGETIALGGLILDNSTRSGRGLPGLREVPVVGNLFGSRSNNRAKTELLVLITLHVIRDGAAARQVSDEFRARLSGPDALVTGQQIPAGLHRMAN